MAAVEAHSRAIPIHSIYGPITRNGWRIMALWLLHLNTAVDQHAVQSRPGLFATVDRM